MLTDNHFNNGLLFLSYLIMVADGILDEVELDALKKICRHEAISLDYLDNFIRYTKVLPEKEVYNKGLEEIAMCNDEEKLRVFGWLYRISEVDGTVHVKEIRFLIYSLKKAGIDFEDIISEKDKLPALF